MKEATHLEHVKQRWDFNVLFSIVIYLAKKNCEARRKCFIVCNNKLGLEKKYNTGIRLK